MIEEICWFLLWIILLILVHYQFKVCIPVSIWCLKIVESFALLLIIKLYVFFMIYGDGFNMETIKNTTIEMYKNYASKFEL